MSKRKSPLILLWLILSVFQLLAILLVILYMPFPYQLVAILLLAIVFLLWSYASQRTYLFCKRMRIFFRNLLAGNFKTGIPGEQHFCNEFTRIEKRANQFSEQLIEYDRLRAERVSMYARALTTLLNRSSEALIAVDVQKKTFRLNPAARLCLTVERENYSFEALLSPPTNMAFKTTFNDAMYERKVQSEQSCSIQIPGMEMPLQISLSITPLRNSDESVTFAFIQLLNQE